MSVDRSISSPSDSTDSLSVIAQCCCSRPGAEYSLWSQREPPGRSKGGRMTDYSNYKYLNVSVRDAVALVEISHPEYDDPAHYELSVIWNDLDTDPSVRSIILTWAVPPSGPPPRTTAAMQAKDDEPAP